MVEPNGRSYEGNWVKGKQSGEGTMIWPQGHKYTGEWLDN